MSARAGARLLVDQPDARLFEAREGFANVGDGERHVVQGVASAQQVFRHVVGASDLVFRQTRVLEIHLPRLRVVTFRDQLPGYCAISVRILRSGLDGVPIEVVAGLMNSNANALYKMIHDARKKLRAFLSEEGFTFDKVAPLFEKG